MSPYMLCWGLLVTHSSDSSNPTEPHLQDGWMGDGTPGDQWVMGGTSIDD